jgi:hypothetical protein
MIPADLIDRARRTDILETASRFGKLKRASSTEFCGPCPVCGGTDRFGVNTRKLIWNCRGCMKSGDVIALVQHVTGATFAEAIAKLTGEEWKPAPIKAPRRDLEHGDGSHERRQHDKARWLWAQRAPLAGSIAERYLRQARGYGGPLPATLGFLKLFKPEYPPALIAAFAMPQESEPGILAAPRDVGSVLLIALRADGSGKADVKHPKKTIGSPCGLPLAVSAVTDLLGLAITEGLEDALSVYEATGLGAWAAGGADLMPKLAAVVPPYVEAVTISADPDTNGQRGTNGLARNLAERGIEVFIQGGP